MEEQEPIALRPRRAGIELRAASARSFDQLRTGRLGNEARFVGRTAIDKNRLLHHPLHHGRDERSKRGP
jgi:hypothetical protein